MLLLGSVGFIDSDNALISVGRGLLVSVSYFAAREVLRVISMTVSSAEYRDLLAYYVHYLCTMHCWTKTLSPSFE
jgi:hypothetical protein